MNHRDLRGVERRGLHPSHGVRHCRFSARGVIGISGAFSILRGYQPHMGSSGKGLSFVVIVGLVCVSSMSCGTA